MTTPFNVTPENLVGIDILLGAAGGPTLSDIEKTNIESLDKVEKLETTNKSLDKKLKELQKKVTAMAAIPQTPVKVKKSTSGSTELPSGKVEYKRANLLFGFKRKTSHAFKMLDFDVPVWKWDKHQHPHVPEADENYVFRHELLAPVLWALTNNKKAWVHGHTGTGKSTLIEEIAARLNWPMQRVNFDSEVTRMDLIGRDTLKQDNGTTISEFVDGILPLAMQGPYILLCDEVDFIRPDVAYVMQRALEDKGLMIAEDGGRTIIPHEMFRIVATGNTQGQGDDFGIYQGARAQSTAFLDRFTVWVDVPHLKRAEEERIIKARVPTLGDEQVKIVLDYVDEHRKSFTNGEIVQPLSPRGVTALSEAMVMFTAYSTTDAKGIDLAFDTVIRNKSNPQDRAVINGIIDRVVPAAS